MTSHNEIKTVMEAIKARKLGTSKRIKIAECFLKLAIAGSGRQLSMKNLIERANPNPSEINLLLMYIDDMENVVLAYVIIGCRNILAEAGYQYDIEALKNMCHLSSAGMTTLQQPSKQSNKTWKPFSL